MISVLKDWLPMVISIIAIIVSVKMNNKNKIQEQNYNNIMINLEEQKIVLHSQERRTDELFMKLNSRSNLIPFFQIVLDDSKIENIEGDKKIKLTIGIRNIGKESANNIMLYPMEDKTKNYFVTVNEQHNSYFLYEYLSKYYALYGDLVEFSLTKDIPLENEGKINDFIRFKVRFKDLLGNLYEQKFEFGYDNYLVKGYNLKNYSSIPSLIEE